MPRFREVSGVQTERSPDPGASMGAQLPGSRPLLYVRRASRARAPPQAAVVRPQLLGRPRGRPDVAARGGRLPEVALRQRRIDERRRRHGTGRGSKARRDRSLGWPVPAGGPDPDGCVLPVPGRLALLASGARLQPRPILSGPASFRAHGVEHHGVVAGCAAIPERPPGRACGPCRPGSPASPSAPTAGWSAPTCQIQPP